MSSFQVCTDTERVAAYSETDEAKLSILELFSPITTPTEWLEDFPDKRQSFHAFSKVVDKGKQGHSLSKDRNSIYICFLSGKRLDWLFHCIEDFFAPVPVKILEYESSNVKCEEITEDLKRMLPDDCFSLMGITDLDMRARGFNYIIGKATLRDRVGVTSYARYTKGWKGFIPSESDESMEWRILNVVIHEICHTFGMAHCVYFHCVMNGSHTGDDRPLLLCPICEKKLQYQIQKVYSIDFKERHGNLLKCYEAFCPTEFGFVKKMIF